MTPSGTIGLIYYITSFMNYSISISVSACFLDRFRSVLVSRSFICLYSVAISSREMASDHISDLGISAVLLRMALGSV